MSNDALIGRTPVWANSRPLGVECRPGKVETRNWCTKTSTHCLTAEGPERTALDTSPIPKTLLGIVSNLPSTELVTVPLNCLLGSTALFKIPLTLAPMEKCKLSLVTGTEGTVHEGKFFIATHSVSALSPALERQPVPGALPYNKLTTSALAPPPTLSCARGHKAQCREWWARGLRLLSLLWATDVELARTKKGAELARPLTIFPMDRGKLGTCRVLLTTYGAGSELIYLLKRDEVHLNASPLVSALQRQLLGNLARISTAPLIVCVFLSIVIPSGYRWRIRVNG